MSDLLLVGLLAGGTLLMRSSMVVVLANVTLSDRVDQALRSVMPAVLGGLVAQSLLLDEGSVRPWDSWHVAALIAAFVAWRSRSIAVTLAAGMVALWLLEAVR